MDNNPKNIALIFALIITINIWTLKYTLMTCHKGWLLMHNKQYIIPLHKNITVHCGNKEQYNIMIMTADFIIFIPSPN